MIHFFPESYLFFLVQSPFPSGSQNNPFKIKAKKTGNRGPVTARATCVLCCVALGFRSLLAWFRSPGGVVSGGVLVVPNWKRDKMCTYVYIIFTGIKSYKDNILAVLSFCVLGCVWVGGGFVLLCCTWFGCGGFPGAVCRLYKLPLCDGGWRGFLTLFWTTSQSGHPVVMGRMLPGRLPESCFKSWLCSARKRR